MATSDTFSLSTESFKMPSEPCALPSLGSDEESFVVLWKDMDGKSLVEISHEPIGTGVVEEAKQLINKELSEMEQMSLRNKDKKEAEISLSCDGLNGQNDANVENSKEDQLTVLPKMPKVENGFDTSEVISITTLSTDLTSEQVQKKVSEIVEENIRLKDTILQNNMSMKSQYERIVAWQDDVQNVHQTHKEKIIEAKELIERLKKENYNLVRELEQSKASKNGQEEEIKNLQQALRERDERSQERLRHTTDGNIKEFELDAAHKKVRDLELAMKNLSIENASLLKNNAQLMGASSKIEDYEKEFDKLQAALLTSKRETEQVSTELTKARSQGEEKLKSLNEVIDSLRTQLFFTSQQQNMLPSPEEVANVRQQLANTQHVLTQVEQSRSAAYVQIESLNKEILDLRSEMGGSRAQGDEIFALKAQLDVYKADFEAEKNAKETIKIEKEKLAEDMQNLQRRNQQLQEEIELLREQEYVVPPSTRRDRPSAPSAPSASSVSSNEHPMKCPVCNFGFKTHQALETHVYRCIELDDHLP